MLSPAAIAGIGLLVLVVALVAFIISRIRVAGPAEAFIVTGRRGKGGSDDLSGQKVVMGASVFVVPFIQKLGVMSLSSRQIGVSVPAAVSLNGIRCSLEGVAVVKVGGTEEMIRAAAQRFLGQQEEIEPFTKEVLAGSLRAIVGRLTVEQIIRDRAQFAALVAEEAETSLTNQGLVLDTFQLQDIQAEGNYLADLGRPEAARAEKEASIAEAVAKRESEQARIIAEEEIAVSQRQLELRRAEIQAETDAAAARAAAAGPMEQAARDQEIMQAQEAVAERRAALKERELDTEIRKPADAARYAVEQEAQAQRTKDIAEAEAQAQTTRLSGTAEKERREALAAAARTEGEAAAAVTEAKGRADAMAEAERVRQTGLAERERRQALAEALRTEGEAEATAITARGAAEASAIQARGEAEAEAMQKKAAAYDAYGDAAVIDLVASTLPEVVREAAAPMAAIDQMTVISTDGASQTVRSATNTITQGNEILRSVMGLDLAEVVGSFLARGDGPTSSGITAADGAEHP